MRLPPGPATGIERHIRREPSNTGALPSRSFQKGILTHFANAIPNFQFSICMHTNSAHLRAPYAPGTRLGKSPAGRLDRRPVSIAQTFNPDFVDVGNTQVEDFGVDVEGAVDR